MKRFKLSIPVNADDLENTEWEHLEVTEFTFSVVQDEALFTQATLVSGAEHIFDVPWQLVKIRELK